MTRAATLPRCVRPRTLLPRLLPPRKRLVRRMERGRPGRVTLTSRDIQRRGAVMHRRVLVRANV